jgi:hypothetical protein
MDAAAMRTLFDTLQDKTGEPWFEDSEKDQFLTIAQWKIINQAIDELEADKDAINRINTLVKDSPSPFKANSLGFLQKSSVETSLGGDSVVMPLSFKTLPVATTRVTLSGTSGEVTNIFINGVSVMSGSESFDTDLSTTAANVASNINSNISTPNYTASSDGATITIYALPGTGTTPNGYVVLASVISGDLSASDEPMSGGIDADQKPIEFARSNDIARFEDNTYKKSSDDYPKYTESDLGWQIYADSAGLFYMTGTFIVEPTAIDDLPARMHNKQVAMAMAETGLVTEAEALAMIGARGEAE